MKKIISVFLLILGILCRLIGIIMAIVALQLFNEKDVYAALASLAIGAVFMFLPDLIKNRISKSE